MVRLYLVVCIVLSCLLASSGSAEWRNMKGESLPDTVNRKSLNDFGAMLTLTDKQDALFESWLKPGKAVGMDVTNKVEKNNLISVLIFFSGCTADTKGNCNVKANYIIWNPEGKLFREMPNTDVWVNKPGPKKGSLELTEGYIKIKPTSLGKYIVEAEVIDVNGNINILLRSQFEAVEKKPPNE